MCLYTEKRAKRAKHDIVVYKTLLLNSEEKNWMGLYMYNMYKFPVGELIVNKEFIGSINKYKQFKLIEGGYFHAFTNKEKAITLKKLNYDVSPFCGHVIKTVECIIPKNALYYTDGEACASRKLIVTEKEVD